MYLTQTWTVSLWHPSVTCQGPIVAPSKCQNYVSLENRNFLVDHEILSSSKLDQDQPFSIIKCSKEMETIKVFIIHIIKNHFSKLQNELFLSRKSIFRVLTCPLSLMTIINDFRKKNDSSHFQILNFQCLEIFSSLKIRLWFVDSPINKKLVTSRRFRITSLVLWSILAILVSQLKSDQWFMVPP